MTPVADASETHDDGSTSGIDARFAGVSIVLGRIALIRTPCARTSCAEAWAIVTAAAFDAAADTSTDGGVVRYCESVLPRRRSVTISTGGRGRRI